MKIQMNNTTLVFLTLFLCFKAFSQNDGLDIVLQAPGVYVTDFPAISSITFKNTSERISHFIPNLDLAREVDMGMALIFSFSHKDNEKSFHVGYSGFGFPELDVGPAPPQITLAPGEEVTLTFDINQLLIGRDLKHGSYLPETGEYELKVYFYHRSWSSNNVKINVRNPNGEERKFVESVMKQGLPKKWFPSVVINKDIVLPDHGLLPDETRELVDCVNVMRLGIDDSRKSLSKIEENKANWRSLTLLVSQLKYECVVAINGSKSKEATQLRAEMQDSKEMVGVLTNFDKNGSLLYRFTQKRKNK